MWLGSLDALTKFVTSPTGCVAVATFLGGSVWKAFDKWADLASENDRLAMWIWLSDPRFRYKVERWPSIFLSLFKRVFGQNALSWRAFFASTAASLLLYIVISCILVLFFKASSLQSAVVVLEFNKHWAKVLPFIIGVVVSDYCSFLQTRLFLKLIRNRSTLITLGAMIGDVAVSISVVVGFWSLYGAFWESTYEVLKPLAEIGLEKLSPQFVIYDLLDDFQGIWVIFIRNLHQWVNPSNIVELVTSPFCECGSREDLSVLFFACASSLFSSLCLWLYAGASLFLKLAMRLDVTIPKWFGSHFDIEQKPIQCIGFVSGFLVVCVFWVLVALRFILRRQV
jgi:hypothetical protein